MIIINNKTNNTIGPYNGQTIAPNSNFNVAGSVTSYLSDGKLLSDVISNLVSITFAGNETVGAVAASLLLQLGQIMNADSDGANFSRAKQAPTGWTFQLRNFEFQTCQLSSIINKDFNNNSLFDINISFYDNNNNLLTQQSDLDNLCVKTVVDCEPTYDYYLIGGEARTLTIPINDTRLSVVAVPDYPANLGGSKVMIQNLNMRYLSVGEKIQADGRASKGLLYNNPIPHTNKLRFIVYHTAGDKISFSIALEIYKQ